MITIISITGIRYDVDEATKKYVTKKIGRLERFLPRHARKSATAEVILKQIDKSEGNKYQAEVNLVVPDRTLTASDSTGNMYAAIDIVESKLAGQLRRYKTESITHLGKRGMLSRFKRSQRAAERDDEQL